MGIIGWKSVLCVYVLNFLMGDKETWWLKKCTYFSGKGNPYRDFAYENNVIVPNESLQVSTKCFQKLPEVLHVHEKKIW